MRDVLLFLREMRASFPGGPEDKSAHRIEFNGLHLIVTLFHGGEWRQFRLDERDLSRDPLELAAEITQLNIREIELAKRTS